MSIKQVIGIASWLISKYEGIKSFVKTKYRGYRSRKIRNAVDKRNARAIKRIMQDIKNRRRERRDSS